MPILAQACSMTSAFLIDLLVAQSAFGFLLQFEQNFDCRHVLILRAARGAAPGFENTELGALERRWKTWVRLEPSNREGVFPLAPS
jgi:hypothetical protein